MEYELTHESMSAEREKALREKKERAEKNDRPAATRLAALSSKIDEAKAASDAIRADIIVLNTRLDSIKAAREAEEGKLNAIRAANNEARSDIPALTQEKKDLWEVRARLRACVRACLSTLCSGSGSTPLWRRAVHHNAPSLLHGTTSTPVFVHAALLPATTPPCSSTRHALPLQTQAISALRDKQREIRVAFQAKWDEFKKLDRAWKGWFAEERKKRCAGVLVCVCVKGREGGQMVHPVGAGTCERQQERAGAAV